MLFRSGKSRFWSKPRGGKGEFAATPNLAPVARRVAACGPLCDLVGRRWGTGTTQPIWARVGELFGAPKAKQEKGAASWTPPPRSLLPTVRAVAPFHQRRRRRGFSAGGGVENRNDPAITGKAAGSRQNFKEENEMTNNKEKYAFWLTPEAKKMIEINAPLANCGSQSEFVEKAVRFYDGYLKVQNAGAFLPHAVADVLEGSLGVFENRMAKLLFNLAVEHNITNHLLAADVDMTREEYNKLRGGSVREVTSTRGTISLRDMISDSQE
jgi:hypothetical protein